MSAQLEETAILGLRAQIIGKYTRQSACQGWTLLTFLVHVSDNLRLLKYETEDPVITTACNPDGWTAVIFIKHSGYPIYSTHGGDPTVVAALRNMLKHTSEKVEDKFDHFREGDVYHDRETSTGIEFKVSPVSMIKL